MIITARTSPSAAGRNYIKMTADVATFVFYTVHVSMFSHLQKVQAFPGDQDVHADPSCLYLPFLQLLPSHHGVQQVPTTTRHTDETIVLVELGKKISC